MQKNKSGTIDRSPADDARVGPRRILRQPGPDLDETQNQLSRLFWKFPVQKQWVDDFDRV
jgi:hypothetical protein